MDSGASRHMTLTWELFNNLMEQDLEVHVELGNDAKYAIKGVETISF